MVVAVRHGIPWFMMKNLSLCISVLVTVRPGREIFDPPAAEMIYFFQPLFLSTSIPAA